MSVGLIGLPMACMSVLAFLCPFPRCCLQVLSPLLKSFAHIDEMIYPEIIRDAVAAYYSLPADSRWYFCPS